MINTSNAYKEAIKKNRILHHKAEISFVDGTVLTAEDTDMFVFQIEDNTSNTNTFDLGSAIAKQLTLKLDNLNGVYDTHDFNEAEIKVKAGLEINGVTEWLDKGKYISEPGEDSGATITVKAFDNMLRFDKQYSVSKLKYPATLGEIVRDACSCCNVTLAADSASFENDSYVVSSRPDDSVTFRQVLQWVGQISCLYAKINTTGQLSFRRYDLDTLEATWIRHREDSDETICQGNTTKIDVDDSDIVQISDLMSGSTINTDDVVVTGIRISEESSETAVEYQSGTDGYVLQISGNKLIQDGKGETVATYLGNKLIGLKFRPVSIKCQGDPAREAGDLGLITDRKGKCYKTILTGVTYAAFSAQTLISGAESPVRMSSTRYSVSTQIYREFRQMLSKQKSEWEKALEDLEDAMTEPAGLYPVTEMLEDGSRILYLCNKPTKEESDVVIEFNAKGWAMSTNGGTTWNSGALVDGTVIAKILNTIGINADWVNAGAYKVVDKDGNVTFLADTETGKVEIVAESFSLRGKTIEEISEQQVNDFVDAVYTPAISNLQAQIDGQIETWFYDHIPTTDNLPASEWTTENEKEKHLGDLFYVVDNEDHGGEAYRWAKINGEYTWDYVEDTAVMEALAKAAHAQDTADNKRRVFVTTPTPPYDIGDLWVGDDSSELMRCKRARTSGNYVAEDWIKAVKYTDDSGLYEFVQNDYSNTIQKIYDSVDQKAETWYQSTDPSLEWTEKAEEAIQDINGEDILDTAGNPIIGIWAKEKVTHEGDLWKNSTTNIEYIYQDGEWVEMPIPDEVFDIIEGKAQIFVTQPEPPYAVGDLWFDSETADIMTCIQNRSSGQYNAQDWEKRNKYTDNSYAEEVAGDLSDFAEVVAGDIDNLQTQVDGKIETWYFDYQPTMSNIPASDWTTEEQRQKHAGDLFYWESKGFAYRFMKDGAWKWQPIQDSDISEALNAAAEAKDTADGKRRVFVSTPVPPYDVGDLWAQGESGDIMRCKTARQSGAYVSSDWEKASKYTDDSAVADLDLALDQWGIFNRLTNNGETEGVYLENGQLYISFSIARGGTLRLGGIKNENGLFEIYDNDGKLVGRIDNAGAQFWKGSEWLRIEESLLTGGHGGSSGSGGTQDGQLDLSKYNNGKYDVSLKSLSGDISLETYNGDIKVYRKGVSDYQGYLVQTGSDEFFTQEGIEVIFEDSTPMKMISMCDNPMGAPRNYKQKAILYRSSNSGYDYFLEGDSFMFEYGNYAVVGIQRKNISALTSLNPNTSINNGFSIDASLRDPSYEYIVFTSGSAWLNTYVSQEPNSSNGYYINITFLNTGTAAHTGSTNVTVIALKKR